MTMIYWSRIAFLSQWSFVNILICWISLLLFAIQIIRAVLLKFHQQITLLEAMVSFMLICSMHVENSLSLLNETLYVLRSEGRDIC